jgi:hypothetical protein
MAGCSGFSQGNDSAEPISLSLILWGGNSRLVCEGGQRVHDLPESLRLLWARSEWLGHAEQLLRTIRWHPASWKLSTRLATGGAERGGRGCW